MVYLKEKGLCHRDVKLENILVGDNKKIKICDFGHAVELKGENSDFKLHGMYGSKVYMAPEIILGRYYSGEKVDVFSCGVCLFQLVMCRNPFAIASKQDPFYRMLLNYPKLFWMRFKRDFGKNPSD